VGGRTKTVRILEEIVITTAGRRSYLLRTDESAPGKATARQHVVIDSESPTVPNDAKLGMIAGMGLVITIAVVFFRRDGQPSPPPPQPSATAVNPYGPPQPPPYRGVLRTVKARTAIRTEAATVEGQRHTVTEGETLFSLARRYYNDEGKFVEIYRVNREVLKTPDTLTPGTVLIIPKLQ
jgi:nucleoid-associated protein YgaU